MLVLNENLKMSNITNLTEKRVKNLTLTELDLMLTDIPKNYKKAIVSALKIIFAEKNQDIVQEKRLDLAQFIEQVIFINMQKQVKNELT